MKIRLLDWICMVLASIGVLGWIDWLWLFGVEQSQSYTWWSLIYKYGG